MIAITPLALSSLSCKLFRRMHATDPALTAVSHFMGILTGRLQPKCTVHTRSIRWRPVMINVSVARARVTWCTPLRSSHMFWATLWLRPGFFEFHVFRAGDVCLAGIYGHRAAGPERWMRHARHVGSLILSNGSNSNICMVTVYENEQNLAESGSFSLEIRSMCWKDTCYFSWKLYNLPLTLTLTLTFLSFGLKPACLFKESPVESSYIC